MTEQKLEDVKKTKKSKEEPKEETYINLIDTEVPLPEEFAHLVEGGCLTLFFGAETRDMITNISAELMMTRRLPVETSNIGIGDSMVLWLIERRGDEFSDDGEDAILAARHIYESQIQDCNREAIILALTAHTEIVGQFDSKGKLIEPAPMEPGQKPLSAKVSRAPSSFMKLVQKKADDIPDPHRNFKNVYEARMKWIEDTINAAGFSFYNDTVRAINKCIVSIVGDLPERDGAGFRPKSAGK